MNLYASLWPETMLICWSLAIQKWFIVEPYFHNERDRYLLYNITSYSKACKDSAIKQLTSFKKSMELAIFTGFKGKQAKRIPGERGASLACGVAHIFLQLLWAETQTRECFLVAHLPLSHAPLSMTYTFPTPSTAQ